MLHKKPLVLLILDGWGYTSEEEHNAIAKAHTPQWDAWWKTCPHMLLEASGEAVGLPDKQMGNSEVGHMHIGAGRVIEQDFTRINHSIENKEFFHNPVLNELIDSMKKTNKKLHIMGLFSPGGVHSHENHLFTILELCHKKNYHSVCIHLFLDGRDTPPKSVLASVRKLEEVLQNYPVGRICSLSGRYFAMDRDKRWERVEPVYALLTTGQSPHQFSDAQLAIQYYYEHDITDEFVPPTLIGNPIPIDNGDALIFFNFRADRARELTLAFLSDSFQGFRRASIPQLAYFVSMTQYDKELATTPAFPPIPLTNSLGEVLAEKGLTQLRIAETEKYAHVTFFFNGGSEQVFENEDRVLIPSPKVSTYDLKPEMSAFELTDSLVEAIQSRAYDVIICNYANADMVGHSGNFPATIKAIECLDQCMHRIGAALEKVEGNLLVTADHGNAEEMYNETTKQPHTAHTSEPVPLVFVGKGWSFCSTKGSLIDIAPTMLALLGIEPPKEMTGHILLEKNHATTD